MGSRYDRPSINIPYFNQSFSEFFGAIAVSCAIAWPISWFIAIPGIIAIPAGPIALMAYRHYSTSRRIAKNDDTDTE